MRIKIGKIIRDLPKWEVSPGTFIYIIDILGDIELVTEAASALLSKIGKLSFNYIVTPEVKSIPLAHEVARMIRVPYIVLRKSLKGYSELAVSVTVKSITTGQDQELHLSRKQADELNGKKVLLLDDVISTGSTVEAMKVLVRWAKAEVVGVAAIATEGKPQDDVISLVHLPIRRLK